MLGLFTAFADLEFFSFKFKDIEITVIHPSTAM